MSANHQKVNIIGPVESEDIIGERFKRQLDTIQQLSEEVREVRWLAAYAKQIAESCDTISLYTLVDVAIDEGIDINLYQMVDWLKMNGYLTCDGGVQEYYLNNEYLDGGIFVFTTPYGNISSYEIFASGKGQVEIIEHLRATYQKEQNKN